MHLLSATEELANNIKITGETMSFTVKSTFCLVAIIAMAASSFAAGGGAPLSERLPSDGSVHNYVVLEFSPDGIDREVVKLVNNQWVRTGVN